jgi:hypothetical protein
MPLRLKNKWYERELELDKSLLELGHNVENEYT